MTIPRGALPTLVAGGMFLLCLAVGTLAGHVGRWMVHPSAGAALVVTVRSGQRAMRVENLSDASWSGCVVTIEGGMRSQPFDIEPGAVERLPYETFFAGTGTSGDRAASFAQAFHQASIRCRDDAGNWQAASVK
ncbi:MAG: hypothetical protein QM736_28540 [Vicinamibacterales bacterium]